MYVPVYWWAAHSIWQTDEQAHGALILGVMVWLFWGLREQIAAVSVAAVATPGLERCSHSAPSSTSSAACSASRSSSSARSRSWRPASFSCSRGPVATRVAWFALVYFIFMIPLPGIIVDAVTGPLKRWISVIVVEMLYAVGYPISRNGVILEIGQYQMLVADACSGLHSMYSLSALGTLFMYIMDRKSRLHNAIMLACILPIAFIANIVRVVVLVLVTYHLGDEAGQGFLHGAAGMVLMLVALLAFFSLDTLLARLLPGTVGRRAEASAAVVVERDRLISAGTRCRDVANGCSRSA